MFVFSSLLPENLFCEIFFTISGISIDKIKERTFVNTNTTWLNFINEKFAKISDKKLEIEPQQLIKPKLIQGFNNKVA